MSFLATVLTICGTVLAISIVYVVGIIFYRVYIKQHHVIKMAAELHRLLIRGI